MVEVAGRPIMLHVMDIYAAHGFTDFVVAAGYKGIQIKKYFADFYLHNHDITVSLKGAKRVTKPCRENDWTVSIVDTGERTMTGGRLMRLRDWIGDETFMVTYSDGVGNVDVGALLDFHRSHGRLASVTAVRPPARFGNLDLEGDRVATFSEKVHREETWINGGFFVFEPEALDYMCGDGEPLEQRPLSGLAADGELFAYRHRGFWHPMDTVRDRDSLEALAAETPAPWLAFAQDATTASGDRVAAQ
jgi:glucose-1-phosphate cytidylyltransferase